MHKIEKICYDKLGLKYYYIAHDSGLGVYYFPTPGKSKTSAMIATNFGSINQRFKPDGATSFVDLPDGIAHFLEHKLFEGKEGNAFDYYAKTGAKANAYTSNDRTVYYFTTTEQFYESLDILLKFANHPYFTDENVEKEKGIIGQEIKMYEDEPSWQGYLSMVQALYQQHPIRVDIAGTVETISGITAKMLYDCYDAFYNNHNMLLCIAGDLDVDEIVNVCDRHLTKTSPQQIEQQMPDEPADVKTKLVRKKMMVAKPIFFIGLKDNEPTFNGPRFVDKEMTTQLLLSMVFGESSVFYKQLYQSGLINSEFSFDYENGNGYGFVLFAGESEDALQVRDKIVEEMQKFLQSGVDDTKFLQARNALYGDLIRDMDDAYRIVDRFVNSKLRGVDLFESIRALERIQAKDVYERAVELFDESAIAMSVIEPQKEGEM